MVNKNVLVTELEDVIANLEMDGRVELESVTIKQTKKGFSTKIIWGEQP